MQAEMARNLTKAAEIPLAEGAGSGGLGPAVGSVTR